MPSTIVENKIRVTKDKIGIYSSSFLIYSLNINNSLTPIRRF